MTPYTPDSRTKASKYIEKIQKEKEPKQEHKCHKKRREFNDHGEPLNFNEAQLDFTLKEEDTHIFLNVELFK